MRSRKTPIVLGIILVASGLAGCQGKTTTEETHDTRAGFVSLFNGSDLEGWKTSPDIRKHWSVKDGVIAFDGVREHLWTTQDFTDFELLIDWRWVGDSQGPRNRQVIEPDGSYRLDKDGNQVTVEVEERDSGIFLRGNSKSQVNIWVWPVGSGEVWGYRTDASMPPATRAAATPKVPADNPVFAWNQFRIRLVGETLNVELNGQHVIEDCQLPGVPATGPIGLQAHGSAIEFRNVMIKPLP